MQVFILNNLLYFFHFDTQLVFAYIIDPQCRSSHIFNFVFLENQRLYFNSTDATFTGVFPVLSLHNTTVKNLVTVGDPLTIAIRLLERYLSTLLMRGID